MTVATVPRSGEGYSGLVAVSSIAPSGRIPALAKQYDCHDQGADRVRGVEPEELRQHQADKADQGEHRGDGGKDAVGP